MAHSVLVNFIYKSMDYEIMLTRVKEKKKRKKLQFILFTLNQWMNDLIKVLKR